MAEESKTAPERPVFVDDLLPSAFHWAISRGLAVGLNDAGKAKHVPFTLTPTKFPRKAFQAGLDLMRPFGVLVDKASRDVEWLVKTVEATAAADAFSGQLLKILRTVHAEGIAQPVALGLLRSDYMLNGPKSGDRAGSLLQVELNTISSSFGPLCTKIGQLHRYLLTRHIDDTNGLGEFLGFNGPKSAEFLEKQDALPANAAMTELASGLARAHELARRDDKSVVLFVTQDKETNFVDQREIEFALWDNHRVKCIRRTLQDVAAHGRLSESKVLTFDDRDVNVSVVYFRAGYTPNDYKADSDWDARLMIERSTAVKCPNIGYHIVGMKKVQQALALPGQVERFLPPADAARVRTCFAGLWNLDVATSDDGGADVAAIVERACAQPASYVLKPQREGGGNNFYGDAVRTKLESLSPKDRAAFILMERIFPEHQDAVFVRDGVAATGRAIMELGVFGVVLGSGKEVLHNELAGHLVRTKLVGVDEGGVASGYAVLSSPLLTPE